MDKPREPAPVFRDTIEAAAVEIGVHQRTLKEWLASGAPARTDQGYDIAAIRSWREMNRKTSVTEGDGDLDLKFQMFLAKLKEQKGKADKVTAEAIIAEFKQQLLADGLVHKSSVNNYLARVLTACRNQIQKIPAQLAAGYAPEIQRQLERDCAQRIDIVLRALRVQLADVSEIENDD